MNFMNANMQISKCHPTPEKCKDGIQKVQQTTQKPMKTILMNIRDPVDRFVSAFNWRNFVICRSDDQETRGSIKIHRKKKGLNHPSRNVNDFCWSHDEFLEESNLIRNIYGEDINQLAGALCMEDEREKAKNHTSLILHAKDSLTDWIDALVGNDATTNYTIRQEIMALAMEPSPNNEFDFEQTAKSAVEHVIMQRYNSTLGADRTKRLARVGGSDSELASVVQHSASKYGIKSPKITPYSECCLARHLADDYELLRVISGEAKARESTNDVDPRILRACDWGSEEDTARCKAALTSMLHRRSRYLDSSVSCSEAVRLL